MADNRTLTSTSPAGLANGEKPMLYEVASFSGETNVLAAPAIIATISGAEGARVVTEIQGDATNGLDVDVTRLPALPTGTNSIGDVRAITTSVTPGTASTHLGKADDSAHASGHVGVMALAVRNDGLAVMTSADGDYTPLATTDKGEQWVQSSTIGTTGDASATTDTGTFSLMAFVKRALANWTTLLARVPALVGGRVPVDGSGVTQPISAPVGGPAFVRLSDGASAISTLPVSLASLSPGSSAANLGKAEDAAHASGDVGVMALGVRNDTLVSRASADGDYIPLATTALGEQWTQSSTVGAQNDAAATTDTGTFSLLALVKRGLQNWTTLLARIPALAGGFIPVALGNLLHNAYATKTTVTVTLTSLANAAARESTAVILSTADAEDALLRVVTKGQASGTGLLEVYAYASLGDTSYTDGATGTDAAFTAANRLNAVFVGAVQMNGTNAVVSRVWSLAAAFDGTLPSRVGFIFINRSGAALSATGGDHVVELQVVARAA